MKHFGWIRLNPLYFFGGIESKPLRPARLWCVVFMGLCLWAGQGAAARERIDLSGSGWKLWLDVKASWQDDTLYLPPVDLGALPVNPPTCGWEELYEAAALDVAVPGTVEEYLWDEEGDYQGVSWWYREFIPPDFGDHQVVKLCFEAVRLRCEVFLNEMLVGYDVIGNTPFEVDITPHLSTGTPNRLALRITDPGGNFDWIDYNAHQWGIYMVPASHGFGGVTGRLDLLVLNEVYIKDLFVMNKPVVTEVDVRITLANESAETRTADLKLGIHAEQKTQSVGAPEILVDTLEEGITIPPGEKRVQVTFSVPEATPWDLDHPALYQVAAALYMKETRPVDLTNQRFGFRWFEAKGRGKDAIFHLNGRRVVLRSAISWGFWPVNGIFPTPELARRHVSAAKELGLNMLNFHRAIGWPIVLDEADEIGLLYYEEPGGYTGLGGARFTRDWAREKLLRMVKRDRSHPSLIMYNLINEQAPEPDDRHKQDMREAHRLDPTRIITYVSGWVEEPEDPLKLHMLPYDDEQYLFGWYDCHHAPGPGVYMDDRYNGPDDYYLRTENREEIVFYGEEGAIAAPPRLELLHEYYTRTGKNGWDGSDYLAWYAAYKDYLEKKNLGRWFPSIDELCRDLGTIPYFYQGRIIENIRINNLVDGYVINGWECEKLENHSGIVDCFRNIKGRKEYLVYYNQPLYLAVKAENLVSRVFTDVPIDVYIVNEVDLEGPHTLMLSAIPPGGAAPMSIFAGPVEVEGGEVFGQLLADELSLSLGSGPGHYLVEARLLDGVGHVAASGFERVFAVPDWREIPLPPNGAVLEQDGTIAAFLKEQKGLDLPKYETDLDPIDYLVTARSFRPPAVPVPPVCFLTPDGKKQGLKLEFFKGKNFEETMGSRVAADVSYDFEEDPMAEKIGKHDFSLRWSGFLVPEHSGRHLMVTHADDGAKLWLDGELLITNWADPDEMVNWKGIHLEAGRRYKLEIEYFQAKGGAFVQLAWIHPAADWLDLKDILYRVAEHGTVLFVLKDAGQWTSKIQQLSDLTFHSEMKHKKAWLGGNFFVREHPFFKGLPVNCAMNWEYQALVNYKNKQRSGLVMEGEEAIVACVTGHTPQVATAVGIVPFGKGKIVLSCLSLVPHLATDEGADEVAKLVFCNYLSCVGKGPGQSDSSTREN
ncbi:MAG: PA14 domain-containing protein [Planctomycetota bacterium]|jgi:hypothetical protein